MNNTNLSASNRNLDKKAGGKGKMINMLLIGALSCAPVVSANSFAAAMKTQDELQASAKVREEVGLGTGMVLGAIFGGPAGAFVTGIAGTFIAKNINATEEVDQLELALMEQEQEQEHSLMALNRKLELAEQAYQAELLALQQSYQATGQLQAENLLMSLQFSTGSSDIAPHYQEQIAALANLLKRSPTLSIDLSGYTDLQGDETLNHNLSVARVDSVKNALVAQGVAGRRIQTYAHGENAPVVANAKKEVSFYDRRVVVKLHQNVEQTAKN
ncbi:sortase-associated OmpA-like protein PdsO [Thalassomonas actiniarum]|uniref:Sortase-associated OmpA-like protein PdsO n=1 Tax=Thalassomonas actiniarum TaxID=485447 RepID=A0AAF0C3L4_9GAMM|nr:sortase-associated OmpA-like protein PdsO [Thalassomonas actiniarum]WDE01317.1 sortase-associated OmpA-like protein PdsO [Thalassomonas actiniarum]